MKEIVQFLADLKANNDKIWFDQNRERYQETRQKFLHITDILINEVRSFDTQIGHLEGKDCMYRIFRDVRFSKEKVPYKTNYGSYIARGGRKGGNPGYYFQMEPGASFVGGGVFMPEPDMLKAIRDNIYNHPAGFLEIIEADEFKKSFILYADDKLKTAPKGYPKEWEHIDLLRYKSYCPFSNISDEELLSPDLLEILVDRFRKVHEFNLFLYDAIDGKMA